MRMMTALVACLVMAACIDMDLTLDLSDGETVQTRAELTMTRQLYDMMGETPTGACPDGEATLTADSFRCVMETSRSIADLLADGGRLGFGGQFDASEAARLEALPGDDLRITLDLGALTDGSAPPPEDIAAMEPMLRGALAGHSMVFRVIGAQIVTTTGTVSDDGTTAEYVIPMVAFLDAQPDLGPAFVTDLKLETSCWLWVFCD